MRPDDVAEEKIKNRRRRAAHVLLLVLVVVVVVCFQKRERERVFFSLSLSLSLSLFVTSFKAKERRPRSQSDFLSKFPLFFFTPFLGFHSPFSFFFFSRERRTPKTRVTPLTWNQPRWLALERDDSREDDEEEEEEEEEETKKRDAIGVVFLSPSVAGKKRG